MDCVTPADVIDFRIGCQPIDLCCPEEVIQENLDIAYEVVSVITGQDWCPEESCKLFDGSGTNKLFFNPVTTIPLLSITEITEIACCSSNTNFDAVQNFGKWVQFPCEGCFPCGNKNIQICGLWGKTMPAGIKRAIILLALEITSPGIAGLYTPNGVQSATWEDFRIAYSIEERPRGTMTTGFQEIDDLLAMYTNTSNDIHFVVVPQDENCMPRNCGIVSKKSSDRGGSCERC